MNFWTIGATSLAGLLLTACMSAQEHRQDVTAGQGPSTFTLGKVQSCLHQGMAQDQVIASLGAPNIVTTDKNGHETWVYDKISSEGAHSSSSGGGGLILFGAQKNAGAYETTQKTLTVMIKFNHKKHIQSIDYHQSKF
jgi:outer membrane protein assembly factor BamE (lipoprotein component of BamABCDE complex)